MSTIETATGCRITVGPKGLALWDRSAHLVGYELSTPLTPDERRRLADALDPERDFSGVDWKTMFEHEIRNRIAAVALLRRERDEALRKKGEAFDRAVRAERERDAAIARAEQAERDRDEADRRTAAAEADRDRWKLHHDRVDGQWAKAEREVTTLRTAGAVSRADVERLVHRYIDGGFDELHASRVKSTTDAFMALLSGSDPAVYVVRESDIAAVEVQRNGVNWSTYRTCTPSIGETVEDIRRTISDSLQEVVECEAVARRIEAEQAVDPVEDQTDALADILYGPEMVTDQMRGVLERVVRAGMLLPEQEADQ